MPAITPALLRDGYKLTAGLYAAGIECPPLIDLNRWLLSQPLMVGDAPAPAATTPDFEAALKFALSPTVGADTGDLRSILKPYGKTGSQIGAALGRLAKAGLAEKRGDLWFASAKARAAQVDRSIDKRRRTRPARPAPGQMRRDGEGDADARETEGRREAAVA